MSPKASGARGGRARPLTAASTLHRGRSLPHTRLRSGPLFCASVRKGLPRKAGCLRGLCPRLPLGAAGLGCPRSAVQARRLHVLPSRRQLLWRAGNSVSLARSGCPSVLCSVYGDIRLHVKDMVDVRLLFLINMFVAHFHVNTVNPVPQSSIRAHDQGHLRRGGHQRTTKLKHPCRLVTSQPP